MRDLVNLLPMLDELCLLQLTGTQAHPGRGSMPGTGAQAFLRVGYWVVGRLPEMTKA